MTVRQASTYGNPFAFTSQRYDVAVGLYHFWARTYSPGLGRWLQRDPLGYVDGISLYEYVEGGPLAGGDPFGLADDKCPPLKPLHPDSTLETRKSSFDFWRKKSTDEIVDSLKPGLPDSLKVKPDGTIMDGNTRIKVLGERGVDVNKLPRESYKSSGLGKWGGAILTVILWFLDDGAEVAKAPTFDPSKGDDDGDGIPNWLDPDWRYYEPPPPRMRPQPPDPGDPAQDGDCWVDPATGLLRCRT